MKLYVGNFPFDMTEGTLRKLFQPFRSVSEVKLVIDHETGGSENISNSTSPFNPTVYSFDAKLLKRLSKFKFIERLDMNNASAEI